MEILCGTKLNRLPSRTRRKRGEDWELPIR